MWDIVDALTRGQRKYRVAEKTANSRPADIPHMGVVFSATPGESRRYNTAAFVGGGQPLFVGVFSTYQQFRRGGGVGASCVGKCHFLFLCVVEVF